MITREQFIELSGKVFTAINHEIDFVDFDNIKMSISAAEDLLDAYREAGLPITEYNKIPSNV